MGYWTHLSRCEINFVVVFITVNSFSVSQFPLSIFLVEHFFGQIVVRSRTCKIGIWDKSEICSECSKLQSIIQSQVLIHWNKVIWKVLGVWLTENFDNLAFLCPLFAWCINHIISLTICIADILVRWHDDIGFTVPLVICSYPLVGSEVVNTQLFAQDLTYFALGLIQ